MNYDRPELLERLAAAYVTGTLRHRGRARFERLCESAGPALLARRRWEDRLLPLALAVTPVAPSAALWPRIERGLGFVREPRLRWWQAGLAAGLVALALLVGRYTLWNEPVWQGVATLTVSREGALWRIERVRDSGEVRIVTVGQVPADAAHSYELWALPGRAGKPVSLGLLPRAGQLERRLSDEQRSFLAAASQLAVSIEPPGGSPTGLPTGPVILVAPVQQAT